MDKRLIVFVLLTEHRICSNVPNKRGVKGLLNSNSVKVFDNVCWKSNPQRRSETSMHVSNKQGNGGLHHISR